MSIPYNSKYGHTTIIRWILSLLGPECDLDKTLPKLFGALVEKKCDKIKHSFRKVCWLLKKLSHTFIFIFF